MFFTDIHRDPNILIKYSVINTIKFKVGSPSILGAAGLIRNVQDVML